MAPWHLASLVGTNMIFPLCPSNIVASYPLLNGQNQFLGLNWASIFVWAMPFRDRPLNFEFDLSDQDL